MAVTIGTKRLPAEEAEIGRQRDPVVAVEHPGRQTARENAAEHAGLDRRNAHDRVGLDAFRLGDHAERRRHDEIADGRGDARYAIVLGEAERDADREDQRQIAEDHVARVLHQLEDDGGHVTVEIGRAEAEQQPGDGQHRDRQHQRFADLLHDAECVLEHGGSPLVPYSA